MPRILADPEMAILAIRALSKMSKMAKNVKNGQNGENAQNRHFCKFGSKSGPKQSLTWSGCISQNTEVAKMSKFDKMAKNVKNGQNGENGSACSEPSIHSLTPLEIELQICPLRTGFWDPQTAVFLGSPQRSPLGNCPLPSRVSRSGSQRNPLNNCPYPCGVSQVRGILLLVTGRVESFSILFPRIRSSVNGRIFGA